MLFYTILFVGSVIAAILILYLYNAVLRVGKAVYSSRLPGSDTNVTSHLDGTKFSSSADRTNTPWGWSGSTRKARDHAPAAAASKVAGFDAFLDRNTGTSASNAAQKPAVSWPYREDKSEAVGRVYKVTRKVKLPRTNLKNTAKPWGW